MPTTSQGTPRHSAVVMIEPEHAFVACSCEGGRRLVDVERGGLPEQQYLLRLVHEAKDSDRLVIMGRRDARLAFEREYVSIFHRPERLLDVSAETASADDVLARLAELEAQDAVKPAA